MEDKRYQVFVSSTFVDLQEERKEVMQALLELDCIPAGMELFPASNDDQWSLIKRVIDDCDYYLLIIGGRYGSINQNTGKSYTQMEFEYALSTNKPIISFLYDRPENIPAGKTEQTAEGREKLEAFRELAKTKLIKTWNSPENLGSVISRSMVRLIKDFPAEGWVKAGSAVDEASVKEIARLQKENEELKRRLAVIATEAPKGTERFAQGDDLAELSFSFMCTKKKTSVRYDCKGVMKLTWNEIFGAVAPNMIDECTEQRFVARIETLIKNRFLQEIPEDYSEYRDFSLFSISSSTRGLVKVQLRALGLIQLSDRKRTASDKETYWKLTPYGDYIMTSLLAIKKEDNLK